MSLYVGPIEVGSEWVNAKGRRVRVTRAFVHNGLWHYDLEPLTGGRRSTKWEGSFRWEFTPAEVTA